MILHQIIQLPDRFLKSHFLNYLVVAPEVGHLRVASLVTPLVLPLVVIVYLHTVWYLFEFSWILFFFKHSVVKSRLIQSGFCFWCFYFEGKCLQPFRGSSGTMPHAAGGSLETRQTDLPVALSSSLRGDGVRTAGTPSCLLHPPPSIVCWLFLWSVQTICWDWFVLSPPPRRSGHKDPRLSTSPRACHQSKHRWESLRGCPRDPRQGLSTAWIASGTNAFWIAGNLMYFL